MRAERTHSGTVVRSDASADDGKREALGQSLAQALAARRYAEAMATMLNLIALDPAEPRWHQKYAEVLRTLGRNREAAAAYRRAARRYEALGLPARAGAVLRVADELDGANSSAHAPQLVSDRVPSQSALRSCEQVTVRPPPHE